MAEFLYKAVFFPWDNYFCLVTNYFLHYFLLFLFDCLLPIWLSFVTNYRGFLSIIFPNKLIFLKRHFNFRFFKLNILRISQFSYLHSKCFPSHPSSTSLRTRYRRYGTSHGILLSSFGYCLFLSFPHWKSLKCVTAYTQRPRKEWNICWDLFLEYLKEKHVPK